MNLAGQAEIAYFRICIRRQKDVRRFQIAMDNTPLMGIVHGLRQSHDTLGSSSLRIGSSMLESIRQAAAFDQFQRKIASSIVFANLEDLHDVAVLQPGD